MKSKTKKQKDMEILLFNEGLIKDVHFKIISMVDGKETFFDNRYVKYVYDVRKEVNMDLALKLGLGVMKLIDGKIVLYNSLIKENRTVLDNETEEMVRVGIYYQLENPEYVDRPLERLLNVKGMVNTILYSVMKEPDKSLIDRLFEIFESQKGRKNNVIQFIKK